MKKLLIVPLIVTLLRQCSQEITRYVISLVSPRGNLVIPNSRYFFGNPENQHPAQSSLYSSSAKGCKTEESYFGFRYGQEIFFLSNSFQTDLWPTYHFIEEGPWALSPRDKGGGVREDNHSLPFSTEAKNEWISTSTEFCTACHV